jgi:hypothetical protein
MLCIAMIQRTASSGLAGAIVVRVVRLFTN